jgi:flagellar protein FlaG
MAAESITGSAVPPVIPAPVQPAKAPASKPVREVAPPKMDPAQVRAQEAERARSKKPIEIEPAANQKEIQKAIEQIQVMMEVRDRSISFKQDRQTGTDIIKIMDDKTGDVIRQMPSEELLTFMKNLTRMLGALVDEKS